MSYAVRTIESFDRKAKKLASKYPSLVEELASLIATLYSEPFIGTPIGQSCYKIRLAVASKGKGKRGGARVITYVLVNAETVYLLSIYDKKQQETIMDAELAKLLAEISFT